MFVGRKKELNALNSAYNRVGFDMVVLYGRKRIGKSYLLKEFIKNKEAIYYVATKVGNNRNLELLTKSVMEVLNPNLYTLKKLIEVEIVEKKYCVTEETNKKKVMYVIKDHMFRFWYTFIPSAISAIEMDRGKKYYDKIVKNQIHNFMGETFEEMCRTYTLIQGLDGNFKCFITEVGSWWGTEIIFNETGKTIQSADIDVVGVSKADRALIIGECKFKNSKIDKAVYDTLIRRSKAIRSNFKCVQFLLFSLSGYTDWYNSINDEQLITYSISDLYKL